MDDPPGKVPDGVGVDPEVAGEGSDDGCCEELKEAQSGMGPRR